MVCASVKQLAKLDQVEQFLEPEEQTKGFCSHIFRDKITYLSYLKTGKSGFCSSPANNLVM